MFKTLEQFKCDIEETFEPLDPREVDVRAIDFTLEGDLIIKQGETKEYLESEYTLVHSNNKFYLVKSNDFTNFRISALNGRVFTQGDARLFGTLEEAVDYMEMQENEVTILTFNIFQDHNGNFIDVIFYTNILEG
jgi:hypothetical protein